MPLFKNCVSSKGVLLLTDDPVPFFPDKRPASTLITNLWLLSEAGVIPWCKRNTKSYDNIYHVDNTGLKIYEVIDEITITTFGLFITIYKTIDKDNTVRHLLMLKPIYGQAARQVFEIGNHHNEKLQEISDGLDNGFFGSVEPPFLEIDQAQRRTLETINEMFN